MPKRRITDPINLGKQEAEYVRVVGAGESEPSAEYGLPALVILSLGMPCEGDHGTDVEHVHAKHFGVDVEDAEALYEALSMVIPRVKARQN